MSLKIPNALGVSRRSVLAGLACGAVTTRALAQSEDPLQQLIEQNQRGELGQGFDSTSRTIKMPKISLPTLSPSTAETTQAAIAQYQAIVVKGGWPEVPAVAKLVVGGKHAG